MTNEKLMINKDTGELSSYGPGNYKVPGIRNIPKEFNVTLLKDAQGENRPLYSSKVGPGQMVQMYIFLKFYFGFCFIFILFCLYV